MDLFLKHYDWQRPIRSLGISISDLVSDSAPLQLDLFETGKELLKREQLDMTLDGLKKRFGANAVRPAILLKDTELSGFDPKRDHTIA